MKILIDLVDYQKIFHYIQSVQSEIIGLAKVQTFGKNLRVFDPIILNQTVTGGSAQIDADAMGNFTYELLKNGCDPAEYKCCWHSHFNFEVFWSSTDDQMIENWDADFLVSLVFNQSKDYRARIDIYKPFSFTLDNLELEIIYPPLSLFEKNHIEQEIEEKVETQKILPSTFFNSQKFQWNSWNDGGDIGDYYRKSDDTYNFSDYDDDDLDDDWDGEEEDDLDF